VGKKSQSEIISPRPFLRTFGPQLEVFKKKREHNLETPKPNLI